MKINRVLNVVTNGLRREGITTSQIVYMKHIDRSNLVIDFADSENHEEDVIAELNEIGCKVIKFPNRKKRPILYIWKMYKYLKSHSYDVIHVHGSSSLMILELLPAKLAGVPIRIAHSRNTKTNHELMHSFLKPIFKHTYNVALACGDEAGKWLFGDEKYVVLHNGKDLTAFCYDEIIRKKIRDEQGLKNSFVIGYVGNLTKQKNLPFLVDIICELKKLGENFKFYFIGDGELRDKLEYAIKERNIEDYVIITGRVRDVNNLLNAMDVMVLPSLFEGLPNVVLEWQASGLHSLISDKVTKECKVCDLVEYLPIYSGVTLWVRRILEIKQMRYNRGVESGIACKSLKESGFDIEESSDFVRSIYTGEYKSWRI